MLRVSKEPSQWDSSFEHPKHMLKLMGKKIFTIDAECFFCLSKPLLLFSNFAGSLIQRDLLNQTT